MPRKEADSAWILYLRLVLDQVTVDRKQVLKLARTDPWHTSYAGGEPDTVTVYQHHTGW